MKRRTVILKRILPCIAALLVLANCKNLFQPQELPPAQATEGTFSLKIGGIRAGRTILPATVRNDFAAYTLVFQAGNQEVRAERTNATLSEAITLNAGTWNLTVTAFMDSEKAKPAAQGSITGIAISAGGNTSGSLELKPVIEDGATGTFRWKIDYPTDVTLASMAITPLDEATGTAAQTLYFIGGTPSTDKDTYPAYSSPLSLKTGYYRVVFSLSKGTIETGMEEYLHIYKNLESRFEHTFTQDYFTVYSVVSGEDSGPGSLRYAIANAVANSTILVDVETINLESRLTISKNLTIRGNGVTLTRSAAWTATNYDTQLLYIYSSSTAITVNISRVHFKNGRATTGGAAVRNSGETVNLESCIFSGNQTSASSAAGGAIYTFDNGTMSVKGCTFYNNSTAGNGGAIYNWNGTLTLTGNLFYGNTATYYPVVCNNGGTVTSNGYNVADVALGTGTAQSSGWIDAPGDKTIASGSWPVAPLSFRLLNNSEADNVITTLPTDYPQTDFYGDAIADGAAAGAVQGAASGYVLDLSINNSSLGSISSTLAPDADGLVPAGPVTLTASPAEDCELVNWLVNGASAGSTNQHSFTISGHTTVQAVFSKGVTVTDFTDTAESATTPGTLRYALTNAQDGYLIRFTGVTAENDTITLGSALPQITKDITIEGNGVTLTSGSSQLLYINASGITVNISRVHFKNGRATSSGAAIYNGGATVNLESCIFSGNQTSASNAYGGAIYNNGTMSVKGCTFYNNSSASQGGAIYNGGGTLTLTGNLFYGNTAASSYPVVYPGGTVTSSGYNVVDVAPGTGTAQSSGWIAATTDKPITSGSWPVSPVSFKLTTGSGAGAVITTLPTDYPATDFYGEAIADGAAAGAVQVAASGYVLDLSANYSSRGSISFTPAPNADGLVPADTAVTLTASPAVGYGLVNWLVDGVNAGSTNSLSRTINSPTTVQAVFGLVVTEFTDTANSDTTPGTLRFALTNAQAGDIILFTGVTAGTTTIELGSALPQVTTSVTLEGNGVTLTRSAAWTATSDSSQLLYIYSNTSTSMVNIRRVHFKDGRATNYGAAVYNNGEMVNLESCIFSGNQTSASGAHGGAIYNSGTMSVKGSTFYNNSSAYYGGAIDNYSGGFLTLTGNLFYGNTATYGPVVINNSGIDTAIRTNGYNVADVALGTNWNNNESGWTAAATDTTITPGTLPVSPLSFRLISGSGAASVITTLPADYPQKDFYGVAIADGAAAAAGAVQETAANGYFLGLKGNSRGSVSSTPAPDVDGMVSLGQVTLTANPAAGHFLIYWLIDGVKDTRPSPLNLPISAHTVVEAVFGIQVTDFTDTANSATTQGTLRYALTNGPDEDVIRFTAVTAGTTTIALGSALPQVTRSITIEGNGVTLTPGAGWTSNASSQLLRIYNSDAAITVNISRVHFEDGRATTGAGAAVYNNGETVNLESCIFSGNRVTSGNGGAIYNAGTMSIKGCTFYDNTTPGSGGAIFNTGSSTTLTLTGNLFYGNTAPYGPVVYNYSSGTVTSNGYNVVDVDLGTENTQSGWTAGITGDIKFTGAPFSTTNPITFAPVTGLNSVLPSTALEGFPTVDFKGETRTWPGAPGAVK